MKLSICRVMLTLTMFSVVGIVASAQSLSELNAKRVTLPNGWSLTPAGKSLPLGDLPLNIAVSPN
ncbi:MAG TPA: hypothetical protein VMW01_02210, partial [Williamwhitmania sp.]|nr:hypothetical protein [Williamwhitmania sp.]